MPVFADSTGIDMSTLAERSVFSGLSTSTTIFYWVLLVFTYTCLWIIFKKAGRKRREVLIPIRNIYVLCKIVWKKNRFWIFMILPIIGILRILISLVFYFIWGWDSLTTIKAFLNWILGMAGMVANILNIVFSFIICFRLAKKFWKSDWFWVWLMFLTPIFLWILAFWKSEYIGENNQ